MKPVKKLVRFALSSLLIAILLGGCGDPTATVAPAATPVSVQTTAPTTVTTIAASTTVVAATTPPTTTAPFAITTPPPQSPVSWARDGVCYEVFVRSFYDSNGDGKGDLAGLITKLDYINDGNPNSNKSLGANCIWLMPITASPSYHGYDTTDFFKVNPDYGTNDDFKRLIQEAHKRGIYVIMDLVLNHTSNQHPWFKQAATDPKSPYRDWYIFSPSDPGYNGPFGDKAWFKNPSVSEYYYGVFGGDLPDLNYRNPEVNKQMQEVTRFWLKDMGVDGFRLDAIKHLIEDGPKQENTEATHTWLRDFRKFYTGLKAEAYTIGEIFGASAELYSYFPDQLDAYFEFGLANSFLNSAKRGQASFVGLAQDVNNKLPFQRYGTFLTNHDQNRVTETLSGDLTKMKLAAMAYLTMPGLPFIYYGEEIGMSGSKPDPKIRTPMQWSSDLTSGGFSTGSPWQAVNRDAATVNVQTEDSAPGSLLNLYRKLVQTRRANPALAQGSLLALNNSNSYSVATYLRHTDQQDILVIMNLSDEPVTDFKLSADKSSLRAGSYQASLLLNLNNSNSPINFAPLVVGSDGAIKDYAPLNTLAPQSGYIMLLKK